MPRNGSGVYGPPAGTTATPNTPIESAKYNAYVADNAEAMTNSINVNGTAPWQANQPMGGFKFTNQGAGTAATDSANLGQVQSDIVAHAASVGGSADAITAIFAPTFTAYTAKMRFRFTAGAMNTSVNPTISVDGLGAKTIKKLNGVALAIGDITGAGHICDCVYNGTDVILLNPNVGGTSFEPLGEYSAVNDQTGTTYTFALTDKGRLVSGSNASAITWTVPPNSSVAFPVKSKIDWWQKGIGRITFTQGAGVTLRPANNYKARTQYSAGSLIKIATDEWLLIGDIVP
ncbi:hypothetical protein [Taklimakanibacter deserti]|uniref:hypothetical protein n=1 Tax=Taklimakanibacter deserti TaxID=2267839 RepID=UPI000E658FE0